MRFIGSKERLLPFIESGLQYRVGPRVCRIGDLFSGTASVSRLFKRLGHKVVANDNLRLGYVLAQATLNTNEEPKFDRLIAEQEVISQRASMLMTTPYDLVLSFLNSLPGEDGFFFYEYSPQDEYHVGHKRKYCTVRNARKIDAIRRKLNEWRTGKLTTEVEHCLLLADLMRATNRVANIAGTYGVILSTGTRALQKILY